MLDELLEVVEMLSSEASEGYLIIDFSSKEEFRFDFVIDFLGDSVFHLVAGLNKELVGVLELWLIHVICLSENGEGQH